MMHSARTLVLAFAAVILLSLGPAARQASAHGWYGCHHHYHGWYGHSYHHCGYYDDWDYCGHYSYRYSHHWHDYDWHHHYWWGGHHCHRHYYGCGCW